jgi:hypothetical protein
MERINPKYVVHGKRETRSSLRASLDLEEPFPLHPKLCQVSISQYPFSEFIARELNSLLQEKGTANTSAFEVTQTEENMRNLTLNHLNPKQLAELFVSDTSTLKMEVGYWNTRMNERIAHGQTEIFGPEHTQHRLAEVFGPEMECDLEGCKRATVFDADMKAKIQKVGDHIFK